MRLFSLQGFGKAKSFPSDDRRISGLEALDRPAGTLALLRCLDVCRRGIEH